VFLAHGAVKPLAPLPVKLAELTVLIAARIALFILLPQELKGQMPPLGKLVVKGLPVRFMQLA